MIRMRAEFSEVDFEDRAKAETNLARLEERIAPSLLTPLASLLRESPDPDGALNLLERYAETAPRDVLMSLGRHPTALTYLVAIFGYSRHLAETLFAEPALVVQFARDRNFTKLKSKDDLLQDFARFNTTNPDPWLSAQLSRFKRRHTIRIVLKDVLGLSTLGETMLELSALADVILHEALTFCDLELAKRYGHPQYRDAEDRIAESRFAVVSLGKLGGQELNYGSDIDLIFLYAQDGRTSGGNEPESVISNKEFFSRLAHAVTRTVTQSTPQGEVFRVNLRLRPEGEKGGLAISLSSALAYYQRRARDWELQMLLKARHSAGDSHLTRDFVRGVESSIYRAPNHKGAAESVLASRSRTLKKPRAEREAGLDVELERGGIRDIEFLTQSLQRLHGQPDPWVRSGGTLLGLGKLNDKGWLSDRDYADLTAAYAFLRKVEHRNQVELGHETHRLPSNPEALRRLGRRAGMERGLATDEGETLVQAVRQVFRRVAGIYDRLIHFGPRPPAAAAFDLTPRLIWAGDRGPSSIETLLVALDSQAPDLARVVREAPLPERSRRNLMRLFSAFFSSAERFHQARQNPELVRRALDAVAASDYLAENLIYHPEDIAALDRRPGPGAAGRGATVESGERQLAMAIESPAWPAPFAWVLEPGVSLSDQMALLRQEFRLQAMALGAADASGLDSIFSALARWSALAARAVSSAFAIARSAVEAPAMNEGQGLPIAVLALGRLGWNEFDLASNADLVFVADAGLSQEELVVATRLASRTIEVLSSYTREGAVLAVDTGLRPQGQEGELVVTEDALFEYLQNSAGMREAMAYLKAMPVAGEVEFAKRVVERAIQACLSRFGENSALEGQVVDTRRRLENEVLVPRSGTRTAASGYDDVDFAVSFLCLRHRVALPPGANISRQIGALRSAGLVREADAGILECGAAFLRSIDHTIRLATGKSAVDLMEHVGHTDSVEALARRWGLLKAGESLPVRLGEVQGQVKSVCLRIVGAE